MINWPDVFYLAVKIAAVVLTGYFVNPWLAFFVVLVLF